MANYEKTLLYTYPKFSTVISLLDGKFSSFVNRSRFGIEPAETSLDNLMQVTTLITTLKTAKQIIKDAFLSFDENEKSLVEFKYFKRNFKRYVGYNSQTYDYRKFHEKILKKFRKFILSKGLTETWFNDNLMQFSFIREVFRRVNKMETECETDLVLVAN
jgi:hypothetical protein